MAYADYKFYCDTYLGDVLDLESADKWLLRASDELDVLTFNRLVTGFPSDPMHAERVKKAVCAIAEALCCVDTQRRANAAQQSNDGTYHGAIKSISSGKESVSYDTGESRASVYALAATSAEAQTNLLSNIAVKYLANVPDSKGVNLLYAGGDKCVYRYRYGI